MIVTGIQVTLLTGRSLGQGRAKEQGKLSELYLQSVACCEVDAEDLKAIGVTNGQNIRITTEHGSVIVKAIVPTQTSRRGIAFMPYSLWATQISGSDTDGTGMPSYKGIPSVIEAATQERILPLEELVQKSFSGKTSKKWGK
jgi:formylmethanofuran dehydrogenase subunit D